MTAKCMVEVEKEFQAFYCEVFQVLPYHSHSFYLLLLFVLHTSTFKNRAMSRGSVKLSLAKTQRRILIVIQTNFVLKAAQRSAKYFLFLANWDNRCIFADI